MKRVFICSPYAGDVQSNTERARRLCRAALDAGVAPFVPHLLYPQVLDENIPAERQLGITAGLTYMETVEEVWVDPSNGITAGMQIELARAAELGIPVRRVYAEKTDDEG